MNNNSRMRLRISVYPVAKNCIGPQTKCTNQIHAITWSGESGKDRMHPSQLQLCISLIYDTIAASAVQCFQVACWGLCRYYKAASSRLCLLQNIFCQMGNPPLFAHFFRICKVSLHEYLAASAFT